jgi:hypothetical protein
MAWQPNQAYLGKIGGDTGNYQQSSAQLMQNAQAAMGSQRPLSGDTGPTIGGALGAGMGGAMTALGTGAALTQAGMGGTFASALGGPVGLIAGAGIGILSHLLS